MTFATVNGAAGNIWGGGVWDVFSSLGCTVMSGIAGACHSSVFKFLRNQLDEGSVAHTFSIWQDRSKITGFRDVTCVLQDYRLDNLSTTAIFRPVTPYLSPGITTGLWALEVHLPHCCGASPS